MYRELDNKQVGKAIAKLRDHREKKAWEVAKHVGLEVAAYTKYERGETNITIPFLNKIGEFFDVNPIHFLQNGPETVVENIHQSNVALHNGTANLHYTDQKISDALLAQLEEKDRQLAAKDEQITQLLALLKK